MCFVQGAVLSAWGLPGQAGSPPPRQCRMVQCPRALKEAGSTGWRSGAKGGRRKACPFYQGASTLPCISLRPGSMCVVISVYVRCVCLCGVFVRVYDVCVVHECRVYGVYVCVCGVMHAHVWWCVGERVWLVCYVSCGVYITRVCLWRWVGRHREEEKPRMWNLENPESDLEETMEGRASCSWPLFHSFQRASQCDLWPEGLVAFTHLGSNADLGVPLCPWMPLFRAWQQQPPVTEALPSEVVSRPNATFVAPQSPGPSLSHAETVWSGFSSFWRDLWGPKPFWEDRRVSRSLEFFLNNRNGYNSKSSLGAFKKQRCIPFSPNNLMTAWKSHC